MRFSAHRPSVVSRLRLVVETLEDRLAPATLTWQSVPPNNNNFNSPANWNSGLTPHNNDTLRFLNDTPTNVNHTANNNMTGLVANSLQIGNSFDVGQTAIVGNQLSLVNGISNTSISGNNFIGTDVALVGNGSHTFSVDSQTATLSIGGRISGPGPIDKDGPGTVLLGSNGNSFTGPIHVNQGKLRISSGTGVGATGLANATTIHGRASLIMSNTVLNVLVGNETLFMGFDGPVSPGDAVLGSEVGDNAWAGEIVIDQRGGFNVPSGSLTLSGWIGPNTPDSSFNKTGNGVLKIVGSCTLRGMVLEGTLQVDGTISFGFVTVNASGGLTSTLTGSGSLSGFFTSGNPTVKPIGNLTSTDDVLMDTGAKFSVTVDPFPNNATADRLTVTSGNLVRITTPNLVLKGVYESRPDFIGTTVKIIDNQGADPIIGTFNNLPEGAIISVVAMSPMGQFQTQNYRISYHGGDGNDVTLNYRGLGSANGATRSNNGEIGSSLLALSADKHGENVSVNRPSLLDDPAKHVAPMVDDAAAGIASPIDDLVFRSDKATAASLNAPAQITESLLISLQLSGEVAA